MKRSDRKMSYRMLDGICSRCAKATVAEASGTGVPFMIGCEVSDPVEKLVGRGISLHVDGLKKIGTDNIAERWDDNA